MALLKCPRAFRLRRLAQSVGRGRGPRHFSCKFSHKLARVTRPSAFRPRRLAQSVGRDPGPRHFSYELSHEVALVKHFNCAGSHKVWVAILGPCVFLWILAQNGLCEMSKCISTAQARTKCGSRSWDRSSSTSSSSTTSSSSSSTSSFSTSSSSSPLTSSSLTSSTSTSSSATSTLSSFS